MGLFADIFAIAQKKVVQIASDVKAGQAAKAAGFVQGGATATGDAQNKNLIMYVLGGLALLVITVIGLFSLKK